MFITPERNILEGTYTMRKLYTAVVCSLIFTGAFAQGTPGACGGGCKGGSIDPMNGNGTLGQTYKNSDCGLNYVQASQLTQTRSQPNFNTNGTGLPTTLSITGIPACPTILRAYVWYTVSYQTTLPASSSVVINSTGVPAIKIGQHGQKCWGEAGTVVFRADVTANITAPGNGNYTIDITGLTNKNWQVDGVTLMIIYKDNSATYRGSMVLWDGANTCSTGGCTINQTMTGIAACGASTTAQAFLIVSDMQTASINPPQHNSTLNGATAPYPNDFYNFDVVNTTVTSGQASANYGTAANNGSDCFCWSLMGLYYQTTSCTTCVPAAVSVTVVPTPASCAANNGSAIATASGAPPPYSYSWSTGETAAMISNLAPGTYSVSVTDGTGCTSTQTFAITSSTGPSVTFTATPSLCSGGSSGTASANPTGGTPPYVFGWVTTPVQTTPTASGLAAGTYSVLVADASGCSATYTVDVTEPTALTATTSVVDATCFGSADGSATAGASGGTGPYTYSWSPSGQIAPTATGLLAGNYAVTATDANGCTFTATCTINQSVSLTSIATVLNNASCMGSSDGSAISNPSGGLPPYTYAWSPSAQNTQTATGFAAGSYTVVVTDGNGCTDAQVVTITEPAPMSLPTTTTMASCGMADGSATVNPSGGVAPYTYLWLTTPAVQVTQTANNLAAGTYSVIVTDANGCFQSQSVVVLGGIPPVADFFLSPEVVSLENPTIYFSDASTGVVADWHWNFGDPNSGTNDSSSTQNPSHVYSDTGTFCATLIIFDPSGLCSDTIVKCLKVEPVSTFYIPNTFTPNHDGKNELFMGYGTYIAEFHMYVFDRWGNLIFESDDINKGWNGSVGNKGEIVQEDVYVWKVRLIDSVKREATYVGHVTIVK